MANSRSLPSNAFRDPMSSAFINDYRCFVYIFCSVACISHGRITGHGEARVERIPEAGLRLAM